MSSKTIKKNKFITMTICMIVFFLISSYLSFRYSVVLPKDQHIESVKEIFNLNKDTQIIALTKEISWLTPTLRAIYKENNKIKITEEKSFRDGDVGATISVYVDRNDALGIIWYINIINLIVWIYFLQKTRINIK